MQYANQVCPMAGQAARHLKMCECMWKYEKTSSLLLIIPFWPFRLYEILLHTK